MSEVNEIKPVLDLAQIQEKATEYAMKGAIEAVKDFYTSYNSPFKKQIEAELHAKEIHWSLNLPDIIGLINDSLTKEIDVIANTAVAKSFVPMVQRFLVREEKEINFSEILKEFIEHTEAKSEDDCDISIEENPAHGWLDVELTSENYNTRFCLHQVYDYRNADVKKYQALALPAEVNCSGYPKTMKLSVENATLEIPFTTDVLQNKFTAYIARLVMGNCHITIDCKNFSEEMFPKDECHC